MNIKQALYTGCNTDTTGVLSPKPGWADGHWDSFERFRLRSEKIIKLSPYLTSWLRVNPKQEHMNSPFVLNTSSHTQLKRKSSFSLYVYCLQSKMKIKYTDNESTSTQNTTLHPRLQVVVKQWGMLIQTNLNTNYAIWGQNWLFVHIPKAESITSTVFCTWLVLAIKEVNI